MPLHEALSLELYVVSAKHWLLPPVSFVPWHSVRSKGKRPVMLQLVRITGQGGSKKSGGEHLIKISILICEEPAKSYK